MEKIIRNLIIMASVLLAAILLAMGIFMYKPGGRKSAEETAGRVLETEAEETEVLSESKKKEEVGTEFFSEKETELKHETEAGKEKKTEPEHEMQLQTETVAETEREALSPSEIRFEKDGEVTYCQPPEMEHVVLDAELPFYFVNNELIVQLSEDMSEEDAKKFAEENQALLTGFISISDTCQWQFDQPYAREELEEIAEDLMEKEEVAYASINRIQEETSASSMPTSEEKKWDEEKYHWGYSDIHAEAVWNYKDEMKDAINIGILDVGFQEHADLDYQIMAPKLVFKRPQFINGIFEKQDENEKIGEIQPQIKLCEQHGTHVAGIAAAVCDNDKGIAGVYPDVTRNGEVYAYSINKRVQNYSLLQTTNMEKLTYIAQMLMRNIRVINHSIGMNESAVYTIYNERMELDDLGKEDQIGKYEEEYLHKPSQVYEQYFSRLIERGFEFLLMQSAGNDSFHSVGQGKGKKFKKVNNTDGFPYELEEFGKERTVIDARYSSPLSYIENEAVSDRIICVGAYDDNRNIAKFSDLGERVDILAPGVSIYSTADNTLISMEGTSMAAPYVTGAAACIWSLDENLTALEVRNLLLQEINGNSAQDWIQDKDTGISKPVLNLERSMEMASEYVKENQGALEQREGKKMLPVYLSVTGSADEKKNLLSDAKVTITSQSGEILYENAAVYFGEGEVPTEVLTVPQGTGVSELELSVPVINFMLPEGVYTVAVEAPGYVSKTFENMDPQIFYPAQSDLIERAWGYAHWQFMLEKETEFIDYNWWDAKETEPSKPVLGEPELSRSLFEKEGIAYICGNADTDGAVEDLQEKVVLLEDSVSALKTEDGILTLNKERQDALGTIVNISQGSQETVTAFAENVASDSFASYGGRIYYINQEGKFLAKDIGGQNPNPECIYELPEGRAGVYSFRNWKMILDASKALLYFTPLWEDGSVSVIYQYDFAQGKAVGYDIGIGAGNALEIGFAVEGETALIGAPDGGYTAFRLQNGNGQEAGYFLAGSPSFTAEGKILYYIMDGKLMAQILDEDEAAGTIVSDGCVSVIYAEGERIYFRRDRMQNGEYVGYNYYSCALDGSDEKYYGCAFYEEGTALVQESEQIAVIEDVYKPEPVDNLFAELPETFVFTSGAGGWRTLLSVADDGTFTGNYEDSNLAETGEGYPDGSVHICNFNGKFSDPIQINEYVYSMNVASLQTEGELGESYIENGIRYVYSGPYGVEHAKQFLVFRPGTPVSYVDEGFLSWVRINTEFRSTIPKGLYGLYNLQEQLGFSGVSEKSPWHSYVYEHNGFTSMLYPSYTGATNLSFYYGNEGAVLNLVFYWEADEFLSFFATDTQGSGEYAVLLEFDEENYKTVTVSVKSLNGASGYDLSPWGEVTDGEFTAVYTLEGEENLKADEIAASAETEAFDGKYILPESHVRYLTDADLSGLTPQQICYAKNEIYARHGRKFLSGELASYFNAQPWYQGTIEAEDFTEDQVNLLFNEYEKANVQFISQWEAAHGEYAPQ